MASTADLSNQAPNIPGDNRIGGMPGPLPDSQQRHWIPDERDAFIHWLKGEFAAANAIIDTLCHHLQMVGKPGEYDFVLTCIQQRRFNWTVVLHMQQYFSVAEVVFALQQVVWMKHTLNSDPSALQMPFGASENGSGGGGPHVYRDPRGDGPMMPGAGGGGAGVPHNSVLEELYGRRDMNDRDQPRKSEEQSYRRRGNDNTGDQERHQNQQQQGLASSLDTVVYANRDQVSDFREQGGPSGSGSRSVSSLSESSSASIPASSSQANHNAKEEKEADQGSRDQPDSEETSSIKLDRPEGSSTETAFLFSSKEEEDRRQANVKVTRTYNCIEQMDGKNVNFVEGLELHERVLDKSESNRLAGLILEMRAGKRGEVGGGANVSLKKGTKGKGRESLHLAYSSSHLLEDHKKRSSPKDDSVQPMPSFLDPIVERLVRWRIIPASKRPDWCSINIMEEGDYVPPHVDNSHLERPYCALTLLADCTMVLGQSLTMDSPGDFKGSLQLLLPVGSVLVLQRNSAELARHSIGPSPTKRILITFGKSVSSKSYKGNSPSGISQSPPIPASMPQSSWNSSFNNNTHNNSNHNRQGNNSTLTHSNSTGRGGAERFGSSFKSHKFSPAVSSGVLPVPTARPPAQIIPNSPTSVPPLFSGTPGPAVGAFPPPSMAIPPSWSPLHRPPPPNRLPSAGTGVFFPSSGASTGPGRPISMTTGGGGQRRSGAISPAPPLLQKTNSAPASFASLEAAATAAAASSSPSTPPSSKSSSKSSSGAAGVNNSEKVQASSSSPGQDFKSSSDIEPTSDASTSQPSEANGGSTKNGKEDNNTARTSPGPRSKSIAGNSNNRTSTISTIGGHS